MSNDEQPDVQHGADWSDWGPDHPEEGPSCKCGYNGSPEECAEWRRMWPDDEKGKAMPEFIFQPTPYSLRINGTDGRRLLVVHDDGRVEGDIEDASEAAAVFVRSLREHWGTTPTAKAEPGLPDREALGELLARVDDHDWCHDRVREWEATEQWEKDAHPDEEPCTDREESEWWNRRADAVIAHLAAQPVPQINPEATDDQVERVAEFLYENGWRGRRTWRANAEAADSYRETARNVLAIALAARPVTGTPTTDESLAKLRQLRQDVKDLRDSKQAQIESALVQVAELQAVIERVKLARSNHPACDVHPDADLISCGWKRAVLDIDAALSTSGTEALEAVKAAAWDEGYWLGINGHTGPGNPYRDSGAAPLRTTPNPERKS